MPRLRRSLRLSLPHCLRLLLLWASLAVPALAADVERCRALREQRDGLAQAAMREEIVLVRRMRDRVCPELSRQAEAANANDPSGAAPQASLDYAALIRCRERAERLLEKEHRLLYRNRLQFTFYTAPGAALARQADAVAAQMATEGCPPGR